MGNENKWEYDYSSQNRPEDGTGYPNVGSSGMNTANQYNDPQPEASAAEPETAGGAGGTTPPVQPAQPQTGAKPPRKKKKGTGRRIARNAVALVLAAAMGFAGGFVGAKFGGSGKVVIQQVAPSSTASSSDSADSGITAASSTGTGLTTEQVADMVSPSVVVITTEQVVYSQWSWYGQNQVESGAGSGVIISSDGYILTCAHVVDGASTTLSTSSAVSVSAKGLLCGKGWMFGPRSTSTASASFAGAGGSTALSSMRNCSGSVTAGMGPSVCGSVIVPVSAAATAVSGDTR